MKRILILMFFFNAVVFAGSFSNNEGEVSTTKFHPMPPGPYPYPNPNPNPGPNNDRELCLIEGYYGNYTRVFYGFGERRNFAIRRALQKCQNAGFYNCRVGWCGEVY